jgi:hypothetical protein
MLGIGELFKSNEALLNRILISPTFPLQNGNPFPNIARGTSVALIATSNSKRGWFENMLYREA